MKPVVYVSARISREAMEILEKHCTVRPNKPLHSLSAEEKRKALADVNGLLCAFNDPVTRELIEEAPQLKIISSFAAGYDNIDVDAATEHRIMVTNTSSAVAGATADLTWGLLISVARRIAEGDRFVRREQQGRTNPPGQLMGCDLHEKTLGIIGMGHIGKAVARRALGFDMPVLYCRRSGLPREEEKELHATYAPLEKLLQQSDYVSLHVPLREENHHLIGAPELRHMKNTAFLVNAARGPVVDEGALLTALREKWIAGAALDVFENEPEITPGLIELDNIVFTPHVGGVTTGALRKMSLLSAQNLVDGLQNRCLRHLVNPEVAR